MHTLDPLLVSALAALSAAVLMLYAGVGKGLLSWRHEAVRRRRPRMPRRRGRSWIPEVDEMQHQGQGAAGGAPG